jgi:uncharacterized membrane protein HdeD (DUF308 family)
LTLIFSSIYHTCDSTGYCFGLPSVNIWKEMDYIYAFTQIVLVFIFVVDFNVYSKNISKRLEQRRWQDITQWSLHAIIILIILINPGEQKGALFIILICASLIFFKFVFLDQGKIRFIKRFKTRFILTGMCFFIIGIILFQIDNRYYWLLHTLWHICAFMGQYYLLLGGSKHLEFWKDYIQNSISYWIFMVNPIIRIIKSSKKKHKSIANVPKNMYEENV